ncbi:MAG TPA: SDR family oxidoreductase [Dehalococcoidia bacterium]|nr:SDR family oxidoreductase [Dehalococcoidia bacterium]
MRFSGKTAVVTGAGSGIGRATAIMFAQEGAQVVCADINEEAVRATAQHIASLGGRALAVTVDVRQEDQVKALMERALEHFGSLDVVYNNAGVEIGGPVANTTADDWRLMMDVNAGGVFFGCKWAAHYMAQRNGGAIVNTASVAGLIGLTMEVAYCATKGAVVLITKAMAMEYAPYGVRVNCVCPGAVRTPLVERAVQHLAATTGGPPEDFWRRMDAMHPLGRIAEPEDIAKAVLFLASDDARMITGVALPVDGGFTAGIKVT